MTIAKLSDDLFVSPQIDVDMLEGLKARGIRAIVNNRPDGEQVDQPSSAHLEAAAKAHGLEYRHIPIVPGQMGDAQVAAFAEAMKTLQGPVLAFCRSGNRSASLWALANAAESEMDIDAIVACAADAGFDLKALAPALAARHQARATGAAARDSASRQE